MRESDKFDISSAGLHIFAMAVMLCDHIGMVLFRKLHGCGAWAGSHSQLSHFCLWRDSATQRTSRNTLGECLYAR